MNVKKTINSNKMDIALEGKFDAVSAPIFESEISGVLNGITEMNIDLSKVDYISSAGLRALLFLQQSMDETGGSLTICKVPEVVMSIFEITGFTDIVKIE